MKNRVKDIFLSPIAIIFNLIWASIGFLFFSLCNQMAVGLTAGGSDIDQFLDQLAIRSLEGFIFLGFICFFITDLKTLFTRSKQQYVEFIKLEKFSSDGKLLLNQALNIFYRLPFEYSLNRCVKIYLFRIFLAFILILPIYIYYILIYFFSISPFITALITITVLFGSALLYLFDTKIGKRLEQYFFAYKTFFRPDQIKDLQRKLNT
jgi:hypothetical protein